METKLTKTIVVAFCLIIMGLPVAQVYSASGQTLQKRHPDYVPPTLPSAMQKLRDPKYWSERKKEADALTNTNWVHLSWTGNDAPYAAARARIDGELGTKPPQALVAEYAAPAKSHPNDPLAQFAWAYAVHHAIKSASFPAQNAEATRFATEVAIAEAPYPRTYNYARLSFLVYVEAPGGGSGHFLIGIARRLLQKDPNDFPVLSGLITLDSQNRDLTAQQEGLALIHKMIKKYPEKPQVYDMAGGWHYAQYLLYHNPSNYQLAIANYQKALDMYPVTDARRVGLPQVMSFLTWRHHQISGG